ncbi:MAG TPA: uroporphyrinogen-III synthase [Cyclobacteriaceae bacterium]|jgi:uroporphyrinogen-III synthase|nr:uroporphyrinogen-III synthase [Cyclobacteriaceae bacterium]
MKVLLTKRLVQDQLELMQSWGWSCKIAETLKITLIAVNEVPSMADAWIVSSKNSLTTIKEFMGYAPRQLYCVGDRMKTEIEKLNRTISVSSFENIREMAGVLAKENFQDVIYFCGRQHRQELEQGLKGTATRIKKVLTHESEMMLPIVENSFDVIFVFSPRSAESLLTHNHFSPQTVFACLGATTAEYLHNKGISNTFIASYPDSQKLFEEFNNSLNFKR